MQTSTEFDRDPLQSQSKPTVVPRLTRIRLWMELTRNLAVRDVETRYKHSLLGLYWTIINPLLNAAIFSFVFGVVLHASSKPIPYVVFLLTGLTFWNFFSNGVMSATGSVSGNAALLAKIYFPRVVLPTAAILARTIDFSFSFAVLCVFILVYHVPIHFSMFWIPVILALQIFFTLGVGFIVSSLNVLYRDVNQLVGLLLLVWMYFSPVMYRVSAVPQHIRPYLLINPMGSILEVERNLIYTGHILHPTYLWTAIGWTVVIFWAGYFLFKRIEPLFAEVM